MLHRILLWLAWPGRQVIAAQVRRDDMIVLAKLGKLLLPGIAKLWEAMQKQHQLALAPRQAVQANVMHINKLMGQHRRLLSSFFVVSPSSTTRAAGSGREASLLTARNEHSERR